MKNVSIIMTCIFSLFFILSCGGTDDPEVVVTDDDAIANTDCDTPGTQTCLENNIYVCNDDNTLVLNTDCVSKNLKCQDINGSFACVETEAVCGNGAKESGETCDSDKVDCATLGNYESGTEASCKADCSGYDTYSCTPATTNPVCGNGTKESGEICDSDSVDCATLGNYTSGTNASCKADCSGYDASSCTPATTNPVCGNGTKETGEVCDSDSVDCATLGNYTSGTNASCKSDCSGYDASSCTPATTNPVCGNGTKETGEVCDSDSVDCSTLGNYTSGTNASCASDCSGYDPAACNNVTPQTCGNGTVDSGEVCDGNTVDCSTIGNYESGNNSTCNSDCLGRNVLKCIPKLTPSNGLVMTIEGTINDMDTVASANIVRPTTLSSALNKDGINKTLNDSEYSWIGIYTNDSNKYFRVHIEGALDTSTASYYTGDFMTFQNNIDVMNTNGETSLKQIYYVTWINYIKMNSTTNPTYQISCEIYEHNDSLTTSEIYIDPTASTMTAGTTFKMKMNSSLKAVAPSTTTCTCWNYTSSTQTFGDSRDCTAAEVSAF